MSQKSFSETFIEIVKQVLRLHGYSVISEGSPGGAPEEIDLIVAKDGKKTGVDIKLYRSAAPQMTLLRNALSSMASKVKKLRLDEGLVFTSMAFPPDTEPSRPSYRVRFIDFHQLLEMTAKSPSLYMELVELMRVSRLETASSGEDRSNLFDPAGDTLESLSSRRPKPHRTLEGLALEAFDKVFANDKLYRETRDRIAKVVSRLRDCPSGGEGAGEYERACLQAFKELFGGDFGEFRSQHQVANGFHRFDFIASIKSTNEFWVSLRNDFRSRYVVFEIKNYAQPVSQDVIYSTEKYLFTNALRSVAILVARNGESESALHARQGSLREAGKLIITLSEDDIVRMLKMKTRGDEYVGILAEKVDELLTRMAR